jgi:diguanylate cyclase (GGDEF)-like protein
MADGLPDREQDTAAPARRGSTERVRESLLERILSVPWGFRLLFAIVLLAIVGVLDTVTGPEISFSIFYLIPVVFACWFLSRGTGAFVAIVGAGVWAYLEIKTGRPYSAAWIPLWNSGVRLGFFLVFNELVDAVRRAHMRERALSRTDSLTGLANVRVFEEHAYRLIAESRRSKRAFTLAYADLDKFKQVNDELGHSEGDRVLRMVAAAIKQNVRVTDFVARLGGDEFAILMPDTGVEQARVTLGRVAAAVGGSVKGRWAVGATFGAVTFCEPPDDVDFAVRQADALMYRGKGEGRGRLLQATWPLPDADGQRPSERSTTAST